ncbi:DNA-binding transcriptional LysR family regulator [Lipingzhangella halophila]|uniref:DNA-binding transcriptional LysR family regulator n=1 Tax=Lipingzhangella halophila TaxID=1783352 RepID=A0A7W7RGZ1_9ACTN|nr:DNA-binding transcriptional LysR family regulator [Lipingzhangella halophila]
MDRLRALAAVAQHGSIARAARMLHVTPSGVSQQLAKLEREAGHPLLEPDGRTVRLTHAGRLLADHAARVLTQVAAAEADLADLHREVVGPLRIGAVGSAIRELLPEALAELAHTHPRLSPTVRDGEGVHLVPELRQDRLDLLVIESWSNRPMFLPEGLSQRSLLSEEVRVALSERHPLADWEEVTLPELADNRWTSCAPGTEPYEALVQALRSCGIEPEVPYTLAEYPSQLALVTAGLAAALVPAMAQRPAPPGVRFVRLRPELRREVRAVWRTDATSPPVRACIETLGVR